MLDLETTQRILFWDQITFTNNTLKLFIAYIINTILRKLYLKGLNHRQHFAN